MDMFIEVLKAFFIGVVEGITEWLPISSTGHMILVDEFVKLNVSAEPRCFCCLSLFCYIRHFSHFVDCPKNNSVLY